MEFLLLERPATLALAERNAVIGVRNRTPLEVLLSDYEELLEQLTHRLGSPEQASEALQETRQRLALSGPGKVARPKAYLLRMAANIASDRKYALSAAASQKAPQADGDDDFLVQVLLDHYDDFLRRLSRSLNSHEIASEALQETYLRLKRGRIGEVHKPRSYVLTMASNIAKNLLRREGRYLTSGLTDVFEDLVDDNPGPERALEMQLEQQVLQVALAQLAPKRREIFEAAFGQGVSLPTLALRHGVSLRTIQREIARALEHIQQAWKDSSDPLCRDDRHDVSK